MVAKYEGSNVTEERGYRLLSGIYRVVKAIDNKVESFLEETRGFAEARSDDSYRSGYWDENGNGMD